MVRPNRFISRLIDAMSIWLDSSVMNISLSVRIFWLISKRCLAVQEQRSIPAFEKKGEAEEPAALDAAWRRALIRSEPISLADTWRWPNGDIPYKISGLDLQADRITVRVVPLAGADATRLTTTSGR